MAQIPMAPELGNRTRQVRQGVNVASGQTAGLDAIARLGKVGADVAIALDKQDRAARVHESSTEAVKAVVSYANELKHDHDFETQAERYEAFAAEQYKIYEKNFKDDPAGLSQFKKSVDMQVFKQGQDVKQRAMLGHLETNKARSDLQIPEIAKLTAITGDYDEGREKVQALIDEGVENGVYTPNEAEERKAAFSHELSRAEVIRDIGEDPNIALKRLNEGEYQSLQPEERERFKIRAQTDIENAKIKQRKLMRDQDKELVRDTKQAFEIGMDVTSEEFKAATESAKRLGAEQLEELVVAKNAAKYIKLPAESRKALLPQVKGVNNAEQVKALQDADAKIKAEVSKDGYAFGEKQGLVEPVELDLNDPATFSQAIEQKVKNAEYLTVHYGQEVSPLTDAEADMMTRAVKMMTPQDKTGLALALGSSAKVWEQLDKKNAGLFAMAGAIGEPSVMQAIFEGQEKAANGTVQPIKQADYLAVFDDMVEGVYTGKDRKHMLDAALSHYYATSTSQEFDSSDFEESIEAVSGGIGKINGAKIELPRGVPEDDFEDFIDEFTPDMVAEYGGVWSMSNEQAAKVIQDSTLVSVGQNRYLVTVNGMALQKPSGDEPFIISFDQEQLEAIRQGKRETSANRALGGANAIR